MPNYGELGRVLPAADTLEDLERTFAKWGVSEWNAPSENTHSTFGPAQVWFVLNGERKQLTCGRWPDYRRNIRALWLTLESLRLASQRGILEQYRQFFLQLPPPAENSPPQADPWEVLGLREGAALAVAEAAYRTLSKLAHADVGGDDGRQMVLNAAIADVRRLARQGG